MSNIYEVLKEAGEAHPYKIQGQPDTYSKYNEGWSDAVIILKAILMRDGFRAARDHQKRTLGV